MRESGAAGIFRRMLYVPPSMRRFTPRRLFASPATRFVSLEYDLVEALRPKLVVSLGTGDGIAFFARCQSMLEHDVDGLAYAIDTWSAAAPDAPPPHPLATFDAVNEHARRYYPGLAYVVRMAPFEARAHFSEATIDLLHIEGSRPDVIAGADVEAWYRRVRPGGVIAWYGARADGLWSLVSDRAPSVVLGSSGVGVGLLRKPGGAGSPEPDLLRLLFAERREAELDALYAHLYQHHDLVHVFASVQNVGQKGGQK